MSARHRSLARGCFKITVVRDPVSRLLSGYGNRVVFHKDLSATLIDRTIVRAFGRNAYPDIDEFCQNLWSYRALNDKIRRHFRLQVAYLGKDLGYFDAIYKLSELDELARMLSERVGKTVHFRHLQAGGPKYKFSDLSAASKVALLRYTRPDYDILQDYFQPPDTDD